MTNQKIRFCEWLKNIVMYCIFFVIIIFVTLKKLSLKIDPNIVIIFRDNFLLSCHKN